MPPVPVPKETDMRRSPAHPLAIAILVLAGSPAAAQRTVPFHDEGRALAEQLAGVIDENGDRIITPEELHDFGDLVFVSVDTDEDGAMSIDELAGWRFGMADIATFRDRDQAFRTTVSFVHDLFDRDNDGRVTAEEHTAEIDRSFVYADMDGDGLLTLEEYLDGFIFNIAMRNALVAR